MPFRLTKHQCVILADLAMQGDRYSLAYFANGRGRTMLQGCSAQLLWVMSLMLTNDQ